MKKRKPTRRAKAIRAARRGQKQMLCGESPPYTEWEGTEAVPLQKPIRRGDLNPSLIAKGKR